MGRFFRSSKPQYIDFMYNLPENQMYNLLATVDKNVDQTFESLEKLRFNYKEDTQNNLGSQYLPADEEAAKKRISEFEGNIDEITRKIQANPLEFRNVTGDISRLRTDIKSDLMFGELGTYAKQFQAVKDWRTRQKDAKVDANEIARMEAAMMAEWNKKDEYGKAGSKYDRETGNYRPVTSFLEDIAPGDLRKSALDYGGKVKENSNYDHIATTTFSALTTDQDVDAYLRQQWKFGLLPKSVTYVDEKTKKEITKELTFDEYKNLALLKESKLAADIFYKSAKKTGGSGGGSGSKKEEESWPASPFYNDRVVLGTAIEDVMSSYGRDAQGNMQPLTMENLVAAREAMNTQLTTKYDDPTRKGMTVKGQELYNLINDKITLQVVDSVLDQISKNPEFTVLPTDNDIIIRAKQQKINDYLKEVTKGRGVEVASTWNRPGISEQEAKDMMTSVAAAVDQYDQWQEVPLITSADGSTNSNPIPMSFHNKTLKDMIKSGDLKYPDNAAAIIDGIQGAYNITHGANGLRKIDVGTDGITRFSANDPKTKVTFSVEIERVGDRVVVRENRGKGFEENTNFSQTVTLDRSKGFANATIHSDKVTPTLNPNQNNQMMWRVPIEYNGKNGSETGAIYIPFDNRAGYGIYNALAEEMYSPTAMAINSTVDLLYNNQIPVGQRINIQEGGDFSLWFIKVQPKQEITTPSGAKVTANDDGIVMYGAGSGMTAEPITSKAEQVALMELYFNKKK